jgi:hypothetical protein
MNSSPIVTWRRHFFYRREIWKTTWLFRIAVLAIVLVTIWLGRGTWAPAMAASLTCDASIGPADAILIEQYDPDYLLFERARQIRRAGLAQRVLVPVWIDERSGELNDVALGISNVMATISRLGDFETVPRHEQEPITLNAAKDVMRSLERLHVKSVIVVSPLFRSRRTALVFTATVERHGIKVYHQPVAGPRSVDNWWHSWHGVQEVGEQWVKLMYYRIILARDRT